jgi:perosamine synthetase
MTSERDSVIRLVPANEPPGLERIPVAGPWITSKEIDYVTAAVSTAWYANANAYQERFERLFAEWIGSRYAVALPSCTSAVHLALLALGVGPGDEVIVPELTWIASAAPVIYVGATPVFADVEPTTWCLSASAVDAAVTPRTRAVIPVDLYGCLPEMSAIKNICEKRRIAIVEDAAQAIGSRYRGRLAGVHGDVGVFSFHGTKTMTTGEGGMLVTDREDIWRRVLVLRDHGQKPGDKSFFNTECAYKYKMSALQAALGIAQLERIEELVARKKDIFSWYRDALYDVQGITLNFEPSNVSSTYWMVTVICDERFGLKKTELIERMSECGIDCRPMFSPLSSLPAFVSHPASVGAAERNGVSYAVAQYGLNLPSGFNMDRARVRRVATSLKSILYP